MAWIKVPAEHHPLFREALPRDGRVVVIRMFGGLAALCNGNLFGGLFARSILVRLAPEHHAEAMALDGTVPFDPMGNGRVISSTLLLADEVMEEPAELRRWLSRAFHHALTLPPKIKKAKGAAAAKPAKSARSPKPTKAAAEPTKAAAKPTKAAAKPTKAATKPTKAAAKPTKAAAKPTKAATKPARATTKPAKPFAKRSKA
jgi:TfoX/Sxy family transcriptional regulator of competence genes